MKKGFMGKGLIAGFVVVGSLFLYVSYQSKVIELGYQIQKLQKEEKRIRKVHQKLLIEVSHLGSLDRIEQVATSTLGMRVPSERDIVMVKRIPRIGPNGYQDDEVIPKVWVAEGKSPHVAGMLW